MFSKIYFGVWAVSAVIVIFFTYYAWSWLQSIGLPTAALEGYLYHSQAAMTSALISSVVLVVLGNALLWLNNNSWALWSTYGYFAIYMLVYYFWLDPAALAFKSDKGLSAGGFSISPLLGVIFIIAAGVMVFLDHFVIVQLRRKMYPDVLEGTDIAGSVEQE